MMKMLRELAEVIENNVKVMEKTEDPLVFAETFTNTMDHLQRGIHNAYVDFRAVRPL